MDQTNELQQFVIPQAVAIGPGNGGLPRITITSDAATAEVYLHGAHVTHFQPRGHEPVLFLSGKSHFMPGKAIRGGIPVIFPWFGAKGGNPAAPQHGFARSLEWDIRESRRDAGGTVAVTLALAASGNTRPWLANDFELLYRITVGSSLELSLMVVNRSPAAFTFEEALHTYLRVGDVQTTNIQGLGGRDFIDKVDGAKRRTQPPGTLQLSGETDRVYLNTLDPVIVSDPSMRRRIQISKRGSNSTVVWNPWSEKARSMSDLGPDEWPRMLCIETANAGENAVTLPPGQSHAVKAVISVQSITDNSVHV